MAKNRVTKKKAVAQPAPKKVVTEANAPVTLPKVHPAVVVIVLFHVMAITIYALPKPSDQVLENKVAPRGSDAILAFNHRVLKQTLPVYGYLLPTGFWQYWDMFAPDPAQTDFWCDAEVTFLNGSKQIFDYPHMKVMSLSEKFISERHRKFFERVNMDTNQMMYLRAPFAQSIAFRSATDPKDPPVKVVLNRHFLEVPRHNKPKAAEPPYTKYSFFIYIVDQHKLFSDKGWKLGIR